MRQLLILDEKNYTDEMPVFEKIAVRAVIKRDGKIAMQLGKNGVYKLIGGTVENAESLQDALIREVMEETGLIVKPNTITEIGEIEEIREDVYCKGRKYISHSFFYDCGVENESKATNMTENELEKGYSLVWAMPHEIYSRNIHFISEPWMLRDTKFIKMLVDKTI